MENVKTYYTTSLVALLFVGCATIQTQPPVPDTFSLQTETAKQETVAFKRFLAMNERLDRVSALVLGANADLCPKTRADFGLVTHSQKSYPKHLRAAAARRLEASETPGILFVRKDGPAERAGIRAGDILLDNAGRPVAAIDDSQSEISSLRIRRFGLDREFAIEANPACAYPAHLKMSGVINAYANGRSIIVTTAMMEFAKTDEELALIIGHELAHNTMGHVRKAVWNTVISGFATRTTRPFETEADYVGLYYMARAGYDLSGVENLWRRLGVKHPKSIVRAKTHPVTPRRLLSIGLARQEIKAKRKAGQALLPNYKRKEGAGQSE